MNFFFQNWYYYPGSGSGPGSVSKINVFGSKTLVPIPAPGSTVGEWQKFVNFWLSMLQFAIQNNFFIQFQTVLWIPIRIGSVFRSFLDPDPYSEDGCGSTHVNIEQNGGKRFKILINNSETQLIKKNFVRWRFIFVFS